MSDRVLIVGGRVLAVYGVVTGVLAIAFYARLGLLDGMLRDFVVHAAVIGVVIGTLTWLLLPKQPRNAAVWTLVAAAALGGTQALSEGVVRWWLVALGIEAELRTLAPAELPVRLALAAQVTAWIWIPALFLLTTLGLLLFPDGRPPGPRWRWVAWLSVGSMAFLVANLMWDARPSVETLVYAEMALEELPTARLRLYLVGATLLLVAVVGSVAAVVHRYRHSTGLEHQQFRWIAWGASLLGTLAPVIVLGAILRDFDPVRVWGLVGLLLFLGAYVVAVARFRLYEIDRIISRTVAYAVVVLLLGGVYAAGVIGLGTLLSEVAGIEGSDLVVAGSVLAVAALFRPLSTRVQRAVDRRFNRTGYDAWKAVDSFAQGLRDDVDLEAVRGELAATAETAVQPVRVSVWLADPEHEDRPDPSARPD